jgi:hypothetical protein
MRAIYVPIIAAALILPALVHATTREPATLSSTQTFSFDPKGLIQLEQSYGDVEIQGWDRPEVEITTIKSTQRKYSPAEKASAEKELDKISITAIKQGEDRLKITTEFPSRKTTDLKYVIRAPAQAKLVVHHDMGDVKVSNFTSDIEVTNRIGEIGLSLPEPESYSVDAKARIGDVSSDFGCSVGENLIGQQLHSAGGSLHRQLFLRIGIGDISIRKIKW